MILPKSSHAGLDAPVVVPVGCFVTGISPRVDFVPVFSRVLGAVVLVGGRINGNSPNLGEIWMVPEGASAVQIVVPGYQPMHVVAATIGTADQMLWVMDRGFDSNWNGLSRLVWINLDSLEHEVIWEGPWNWSNGRHWLTSDYDGQVLLTASGYGVGFRTVRFEADSYVMNTAMPIGTIEAAGALIDGPLLEENAYFFVTNPGQGQMLPYRAVHFDPPPPNGIDLDDWM